MCNTRTEREQAAYQFELQAARLYLTVLRRLSNYRYIVKDELRDVELTVMVLASTFDFYEYRLNKGRQRVDLLIVQKHNAVVPIRVLCLADSAEFDPGRAPTLERPDAKRTNHDEMVLLVSKLLLGTESAHEELAKMPVRT